MNSFIQNGLSQLLPTITNSNFARNVSATIELPKMKLESRFQLKNILSRINNGWNHIFSSSIDLSRMAEERLLVNDVNHVVRITQFDQRGSIYKVAPPELKISPNVYFIMYNSVVLSKILPIIMP